MSSDVRLHPTDDWFARHGDDVLALAGWGIVAFCLGAWLASLIW